MYDGYAVLAGNEIINSARAYAGATAHGLPVMCEPCEGAAAGVDDPPYTGIPSIDQAPWYDANRPASARFLGVMGLETSGFKSAPAERAVTELIGDGAALGAMRRPQREMVFNVVLLALDDEAMSYGYEWLAAALRGGDCAGSCGGDELCVMAACPTSRTDGLRKMRHLYGVGLLEPLTEDAHAYLSGGGRCDTAPECADCCSDPINPLYSTATFTLVAGTPYIYREPWPVNDGEWTDLAEGKLLTDYAPDDIADDCPTVGSCTSDPDCAVPRLPPRVRIPVNPCWPTGAMDARQSWITVDPRLMPQWSEMVPVIEVYSGSKALRRLLIRFFPNPVALDCEQVGADPCSACTMLGVAYLPERSTLTLDGQTRFASVDCSTDARSGSASPQLYGPGGAPFAWPVFDCPTGMCIEIVAEDGTVTDTTQVRMWLVPRSDAG
jgi:hypothetical protein